jgi:Family of unknown function (DUF6879)
LTKPITDQQFQDRLRRSRHAFHLELRDSYRVEEEDIPFARWLRGEPDDYAWRRGWLSFTREVTATGTKIERVRVVTEPISDYTRWVLSVDPQNIEAGEEIRYLPRRLASGIDFPAEDYWLFDGDELVLSLFKPDGRSGGFAIQDDPVLVAQHREVRDAVWSRAIPYAEYVSK